MALNQPRLYLICYDIADPKRLGRVHRFLREEGMPVQYSVFTAQLTARNLERLLVGLGRRIDARADDVRLYPLPARRETFCLGVQYFPEEVMLIEDGVDLLGLVPSDPGVGPESGRSYSVCSMGPVSLKGSLS
jgi:CRISPR-associated protein Cas2